MRSAVVLFLFLFVSEVTFAACPGPGLTLSPSAPIWQSCLQALGQYGTVVSRGVACKLTPYSLDYMYHYVKNVRLNNGLVCGCEFSGQDGSPQTYCQNKAAYSEPSHQ